MFLEFGDMPLAGNFVLQEELEDVKLYPMDLVVCLDCSLVQILNVVDPNVLFIDYRYLSSVTDTLKKHFQEYAVLLKKEILPDRNPFLVEIGCNDGVLLAPLKKMGIDVLGVDAAENVVQLARQRGVEVINGYFHESIAEHIVKQYRKADLITASNVFAHIDDLDEVLRGVEKLLESNGTFIVEVHYIVDLLKTFQFDTVYHEHLCYYSVHALQALYARFGFVVTNIQRLPMHGGAVRVYAKRASSKNIEISPVVEEMLEEEHVFGIHNVEIYKEFGKEVEKYRDKLRHFLGERKSLGRTLSAYGAAGRATILLNYCGLDNSIVEYVVDESPFRVGRYVPGVRLPIMARTELTKGLHVIA
jgi:SAM-dependent methyltransferase